MIDRNFRYIILLSMFFPLVLSAQMEISLTATKDSFGLGENIALTMELGFKRVDKLKSLKVEVLDSAGLYHYLFPEDTSEENSSRIDYEIADYGHWSNSGSNIISLTDWHGNENNSMNLSNMLTLKIWDSGAFYILITQLDYIDSLNREKVFYPDVKSGLMVLLIPPIPSNQEQGSEIMPIKDILKEGIQWWDYKWLYMGLGALLLFVFLITRPTRQKRKTGKKKKVEIIVSPAHIIAFQKLKALNEKELWQKGAIKAFQSELSFITREYLENRYRIKALEKTTEEIIADLLAYNLPQGDIEMLRELLQIADLVKFAKAKPEENIHEHFYNKCKSFVEKTKISIKK